MAQKKLYYSTLGELLYWSYANLAMADAACSHSASKYGPTYYMIRAKLYKGLKDGTMKVGSMLDDEKIKHQSEKVCTYCGSDAKLSMDHLIAKSRGGPETADNVVWVCRSCNSSKRDTDFLVWWANKHGTFPPLMVLRRYLKLAIQITDARKKLDVPHASAETEGLPFEITAIPVKYPKPGNCRMLGGQSASLDPRPETNN